VFPVREVEGCFLLNVCASEREDLSQQIKDSSDQQSRNDLTKVLNTVVARMEVKGEQIVKLKHCQNTVTGYSFLNDIDIVRNIVQKFIF